jgi:hypothetical protein
VTRANVVKSWQRVWRRAGFWVYLKSADVVARFMPKDVVARFQLKDLLAQFQHKDLLASIKPEDLEIHDNYLTRLKQ